MGSEFDNAHYPQCELIVKIKRKEKIYLGGKIQRLFSYESKISNKIRKLFKKTTYAYSLNKPISLVEFPYQELLKQKMIPKSQIIDSYGKTRHINIDYEDGKLSLLTSPIPNMSLTLSKTIKIYRVELEKLNPELPIVLQRVQNEKVKEVDILIGNIIVSIPIHDHSILLDVPISDQIHIFENQRSKLSIYNDNKKNARYLTEYVFWLFSRFYNEGKYEKISDKVIHKFATSHIIIDPNIEYKNIQKLFSDNNEFVQNGIMILKSEEMKKRLLYVLKMYSVRSTKSLINYKNHNVIQVYYKDITDFDMYSNQVILYGFDSLYKWIYERINTYKIFNEINIGNLPYFFKNEQIENGMIFIAQNTKSLNQAYKISQTWNIYHYNESVYNKSNKIQEIITNYIFYKYQARKKIIREVVGNVNKQNIIRIIQYKKEGYTSYISLLNI